MRSIFVSLPIAIALAGMTACDIEDWGDFQKYQRDFHYAYPLKADGRVSVEGFNGSIDISGWDQDSVDISGTKYGPTVEAAEALKIEVENAADHVSVRAVRPSDRRNNEGARFTLRIPRKAILDRLTTSNGSIHTQDGAGPARLRTSNGSIHVQDLKGNLDATTSNAAVELMSVAGDAVVHTSNGHVHADQLTGTLEANTSNAGIQAAIAETTRPIRLDTTNGSVELQLPKDFTSDVHVSSSNASITLRVPGQPNARVSAHTSNASISCDFDVKGQVTWEKNHLDGTLGSGGSIFDLSTSNGGIRLLKM